MSPFKLHTTNKNSQYSPALEEFAGTSNTNIEFRAINIFNLTGSARACGAENYNIITFFNASQIVICDYLQRKI